MAPREPSAQVNTWGRTTGTTCIEGVPESAVRVTADENKDGVEVRTFQVDFKAVAGTRARARLFKQKPIEPVSLAKCSELVGPIPFEGDIRELWMLNARETAPGASALDLP
jgi:hypothetical protein